ERAMLTLKLKVGAALVLVVGILGVGAAMAAHQARKADPPAATPNGERRAQNPQEEPKRDQADAKQERTDGRGDPLPDGAIVRFGSARLRHGGAIRASALAPEGKTLATAGSHSVVVWDLDTGKALHRLRCDGNTFSGPGLTISTVGTRFAYVRSDFFDCVWDLRTGKEVRRFERRFEDGLGKFLESGCQFVNQGKELMMLSRETIDTWNVESGEVTASVPVKAALLSPDGKTYLSNQGDTTGRALGDARTGQAVTRLEVSALRDGVENGLAFSPNGKTLAVVHERKEIQLR